MSGPTVQKFNVFGHNGFPWCPQVLDVAGYDDWVTLGGTRKGDSLSGSTFEDQREASLKAAYKMYYFLWDINVSMSASTSTSGPSVSASASVSLNESDKGQTANSVIPPINRVCGSAGRYARGFMTLFGVEDEDFDDHLGEDFFSEAGVVVSLTTSHKASNLDPLLFTSIQCYPMALVSAGKFVGYGLSDRPPDTGVASAQLIWLEGSAEDAMFYHPDDGPSTFTTNRTHKFQFLASAVENIHSEATANVVNFSGVHLLSVERISGFTNVNGAEGPPNPGLVSLSVNNLEFYQTS